ncbi:MAG: Blue-light-activated protein [Gammaproteobacteria bacterium]|nr:Blue-light-activated protein [Gammaproteobacteria bacterium]
MQRIKQSPVAVVLASVILALAMLVFDLSTPLGIAGGAAYIVLVFVGYWAPWRLYIYLMAMLATILTIIGYYASPEGAGVWVVLANRGLTLSAIWIVAVLGVRIRDNEVGFRMSIDSTADGIIHVDSRGFIESFNQGAQNIFGYTPEEAVGEHVSMLMPFPGSDKHDGHLARHLEKYKSGMLGKAMILKGWRKDETVFPMELTVSESIHAGRQTSIVVVRDVTERLQAEEQLNLLSRAIEQSPVSVVITDAHGNIQYVNPKFTQVSGYTYDDVIGENPRILKSGETPSEEYKGLWDDITSGREWRGKLHNRKKNGELYWESASIVAVKDPEGRTSHFLAVKEDITSYVEREQQLVHALNVEAAGKLTSGIAHDFNNLLTIITGNLQLLMTDIDDTENRETVEILNDAYSAAQDGGEVVSQLLILLRKHKHEIHNVDINACITGMRGLLNRAMGEDVAVRLDLTEDIDATMTDQNQLQSAILNLAVNARDAMPDGGVFTIETVRTVIDSQNGAEIPGIKPGNYVAIVATDTGVGMDPDVVAQAREPYFTTKEPGSGTGLGLSMIDNFARHFGGGLKIESKSGSTVTIYLPETYISASGKENREDYKNLPHGRESVLIVEDMENVRRFVVRSLRSLGYRTFDTGNADTAMEMLGAGHSIDLVFADIIIPGGKNGRELAAWTKQHCPGTKVALTTGARTEAAKQSSTPGDNFPLLRKPFSLGQLAHFVQRQLRGDQSTAPRDPE